MRIIAGKYRRVNLKTLEGDNTRPTRDMVREALFSSVDVSDLNVLDLFSGSGAIGIEALSRGASDVVFNDHNRQAVSIIKDNLKTVKESRRVFALDYKTCLDSLAGEKFDFVYLDPPYIFDDFEFIFNKFVEYDLLNDDAIVVVEVRKDHEIKTEFSTLYCYKEKKYGINKLLYYRKGLNDA